ncbi:MAG TPA: ribosome maturation factor RimM [Saprospiraceae bacterium]|nr:ribosome maturation factor RimM [Saprospiraceae bacterium]HMQ82311.1 ribosome maturation factor RimM [Saprospiraceae bacterium]
MAYIEIGKTGKAHGLDGELKLHVNPAFVNELIAADALFIQQNGGPVPYFIEELVELDQQLLVKLEEVDSKEAAVALSGKVVFLPKAQVQLTAKEAVEASDFFKVIGFLLVDQDHGSVGTIDDIVEYPQQIMAIVQREDRELLIPLNPHFVQRIDVAQQRVLVNLPEGLLDL